MDSILHSRLREVLSGSLKEPSRPTARGLWAQVEDQGTAYQTEAEARRDKRNQHVRIGVISGNASVPDILSLPPSLADINWYGIWRGARDNNTLFRASARARDPGVPWRTHVGAGLRSRQHHPANFGSQRLCFLERVLHVGRVHGDSSLEVSHSPSRSRDRKRR